MWLRGTMANSMAHMHALAPLHAPQVGGIPVDAGTSVTVR